MQRFRFHPAIERWFTAKFGSPTAPQELGWPEILSGAPTLIGAPTGSGKTFAAFLASLDKLFRLGLEGNFPDQTHVVYVSPLKALSNDIHRNLEEPLAEIRAALRADGAPDVAVRAAVRTGDTPASARRALSLKPPHILVTTPESLYLLLTSPSGRRMLSTVRTLIVDEIHALMSNRRGAHLALTMERLAALVNRPLQRIGLSATQKPITDAARFLVGTRGLDDAGQPRCRIIDIGHSRALDLALELPGSPLEAVMSNEVWGEVHERLAELVRQHRTTLVFVNTRRLAERLAHHLAEKLGTDKVASHHGSLSARLRLDAEARLKSGQLAALVATSSLELGIDIGSVDLVCQIGSTRSIAALLQRVGRSGHRRGGISKGRLFPLTRDELVECTALMQAVRRGELDRLRIPDKPIDVLAQQIVAAAAVEDWEEQRLFELVRAAYPYRQLARNEFDDVLRMLAEGFTTKRGRRAALIHHDAIHGRVRARRGARLLALTSGGAIPDNAEFRVVLEPDETFIGTVNEDFAAESMAGEVFQLGNTSWRIRQIVAGTVRVEDARGQPPGIPFWFGEAPARTTELSRAVAELRVQLNHVLEPAEGDSAAVRWLTDEAGVPEMAARQIARYLADARHALGGLPSQDRIVIERFFDESGGMQLVIHSSFGSRINRAWGLALRKRFCRTFNFELQSAATDDAIVLSLGTQHSFPLEDVFHYLASGSVRDLLVQALLDAPMFPVRWRWNATRALALPRQRGGRRLAPALQRMESENLLAAVFPDQLACLENIAGDRQVPDHPLVRQTIQDCLTEAMDIEGLETLLRRIERGEIECVARDLPEPSLLAHEILHARPYAFLDNAPLEERRTQAVYTRRASEAARGEGLGVLDQAAIERVAEEAWPQAVDADELHDALLLVGVLTPAEAARCTSAAPALMAELENAGRATRLENPGPFWVAAERLPLLHAVYPDARVAQQLSIPPALANRVWDQADALRELVRGRMEVVGPITPAALAAALSVPRRAVESALLALEAEGFVLRGKFHPGTTETEWCNRRLLARVHSLTLHRLRAEIQPVTIAEYQRFLLCWHRLAPQYRVAGPEALEVVLDLVDGYEAPAGAWEPAVLASRVKEYEPQWLDRLCFAGRVGWGRLSSPAGQNSRGFSPLRSSPIALFARDHLAAWLELSAASATAVPVQGDRALVANALKAGGALFFDEIVGRTRLLKSAVELALGELAGLGFVTCDSFEGLRAMLLPPEKRAPFGDLARKRHHRAVTSIERAGRWSLLRQPMFGSTDSMLSESVQGRDSRGMALDPAQARRRDDAIEVFARVLLRRYGVVFRRLLERESLRASWFELGGVYRRLEARGEIRGGYFVGGVSGEQFALPEAVGLLRATRKLDLPGEELVLSAADPLNLVGILNSGRRIAATGGNRILLRDGVPIAALEAGRVLVLESGAGNDGARVEQALKVGRLPPLLRAYYA